MGCAAAAKWSATPYMATCWQAAAYGMMADYAVTPFLFDGIKKADLAATSACCEELTDSGNLKHKDENVELT